MEVLELAIGDLCVETGNGKEVTSDGDFRCVRTVLSSTPLVSVMAAAWRSSYNRFSGSKTSSSAVLISMSLEYVTVSSNSSVSRIRSMFITRARHCPGVVRSSSMTSYSSAEREMKQTLSLAALGYVPTWSKQFEPTFGRVSWNETVPRRVRNDRYRTGVFGRNLMSSVSPVSRHTHVEIVSGTTPSIVNLRRQR